MTLGSTVSSDWKSSPASGWTSILAPLNTSLTATGCRLSVGELAGTTTSTLSRTNVSRISTSTCFVAPPCTVNGADSPVANPSREVATTYRPAATSGNVTWPTESLTVCATATRASTLRSDVDTPGMRTPSSAMVTTTRPASDDGG